MLKIAGWIISDAVVDAWRDAQPAIEHEPSLRPIILEVREILKQRDLKSFPCPQENFISIPWPKMTPEARGEIVCMLVRQVDFDAKNETWDNFTPIEKSSQDDDELVEWFRNDGLMLSECQWVTVPDPFESDWPFAKRHRGKRCPPEDIIQALQGIRLKIPHDKYVPGRSSIRSLGRDIPEGCSRVAHYVT